MPTLLSPRGALLLAACSSLLLATTFGQAPINPSPGSPANKPADPRLEMPLEVLRDRIYGGWAGMLIAGLEGIPHEFKYTEEPRAELPEFTMLANGARSDDDNDFEWLHLWFMDREGVLKLPYPRIAELWKANINKGVWFANKRARKLMDEGVLPPETGQVSRNPYSWFNLSSQFCTESYGMISPAMPQTAADLGLHYARISVSQEPLQAAQYWTSLISLAFTHEGDMASLLEKALPSVDPKSLMAEVVKDVLELHRQHPQDWKAARQAIHRKWFVERKWGTNSSTLNGAAVCLAIVYGENDFYRTVQLGMAMGYDADCNAATAGAVVGVRVGFKAISQHPNFKMPDYYVNYTRAQLPMECKISDQVEVLLRVADRNILANGGDRAPLRGTQNPAYKGKPGYLIKVQEPKALEFLPENPNGPHNSATPDFKE